jgi:hypothetical protein
MPALVGEVILTMPDATGTPVFVVYEFFNPTPAADGTNALRDATQATSRGNRTGALIVDNMTGKTQRVVITNPDTGRVRNLNVAANGAALTVAQLAALAPPDGPIMTIQDINGLMPVVT